MFIQQLSSGFLCWTLSNRRPTQCQDALSPSPWHFLACVLNRGRRRFLSYKDQYSIGVPHVFMCYTQTPTRQLKFFQCHRHHSSHDHDVFLFLGATATATSGIDSDAVACGLGTFHRSDSAHDRFLIARSGHARRTLGLLNIKHGSPQLHKNMFTKSCFLCFTSRNSHSRHRAHSEG